MKKTLNSILAVLLAIMMTASIVASEITVTTELPPENDTEITIRKDEDKEPDCGTNCDLPVRDDLEDDY